MPTGGHFKTLINLQGLGYQGKTKSKLLQGIVSRDGVSIKTISG
jgi:hypothetical protein